jgi:hypothetical protein
MDRRNFLKAITIIAASTPFISMGESQAADVQIFVRNIEETIDTNRLNLSSHLYLNQFIYPTPMVWVWTPYGWTIQAQPIYYGNNLNFQGHLHGYHQLTQRRENIKQITIHDADCIYILENGTIKVYSQKKRGVTFSSDVPNYASGLRKVDEYYRRKTR